MSIIEDRNRTESKNLKSFSKCYHREAWGLFQIHKYVELKKLKSKKGVFTT